MSTRGNYSSEPEEYILALKEQLEDLQSKYDTLQQVITIDRNTISLLENQHQTDLKIIGNYRAKLREIEKVEDDEK